MKGKLNIASMRKGGESVGYKDEVGRRETCSKRGSKRDGIKEEQAKGGRKGNGWLGEGVFCNDVLEADGRNRNMVIVVVVGERRWKAEPRMA